MSVSVLTRISSSNARRRGQYRGKRFDFLEEILRAERDASRARAREMFARVAGFPTVKTLDAPRLHSMREVIACLLCSH